MIGIVLLDLVGLAFLGAAVLHVLRARRARGWPTTAGALLHTELQVSLGEQSGASLLARYAFEVGGVVHEGNRIAFGELPTGNYQTAAALAARLRDATRVRVHYDPRDPARACLAPVVPYSARLLGGFGLLVASFGALMTVAMLTGGTGEVVAEQRPALAIGVVAVFVLWAVVFFLAWRWTYRIDDAMVAAVDVMERGARDRTVPDPRPPVPAHADAGALAPVRRFLAHAPWMLDVLEDPRFAGRPVLFTHAVRTASVAGGWPVLVLSALGLVAGLAVLWAVGTGLSDAPRWLALPIGTGMAVTGLALVVVNARALRDGAARRRARAGHEAEPWTWDYPWDARGAHAESAVPAWQVLLGVPTILLLVAPLHWDLFSRPMADDAVGRIFGVLRLGIVGLTVVLFDLVAIAGIAWALYRLARRFKYGRGQARFARFPFRRGEAVELEVPPPAALTPGTAVTATLRCVAEGIVSFRVPVRGEGGRTASRRIYELARVDAPARWTTDAAGRPVLAVSVVAPAGAPTTELASTLATCWEVELHATTPGVDWRPRFLVPVY